MEFIKKHYDKLILGAVLLGLAIAAFMLTVQVQSVQETISKETRERQGRQKKQIPPVNLSEGEAAVQRVSRPFSLHLAGTDHNLANPVPWGRDRSSNLYKIKPGQGTGPDGLKVKQLHPLSLIVTFEETAGKGEELRYKFGITKEYAKQPSARRRNTLSATLAGKTADGTLFLREIKGAKEDPTELICELVEGGERFSVSKDKPFIRPMGYSVDLSYQIEKKELLGKRVDDSLLLSGSNYKIVAISKDEVVISDPDTKKRFVRPTASAR